MNYDVVYNHNWSNTYTTSTSTVLWPMVYQPAYVPAYQVSAPDTFRTFPEAMPIPEDDFAWLERRVAEVSWVPA